MSIIQDVSFAGPLGQQLAGKLHLPQGSYRGAAIFAHCFTCSKETLAASRIAAGLARAGLAVLRFDFTGLGRSEGAFSDSSFASNIEDLKAAAQFMAAEKFGTHSLAPTHGFRNVALELWKLVICWLLIRIWSQLMAIAVIFRAHGLSGMSCQRMIKKPYIKSLMSMSCIILRC